MGGATDTIVHDGGLMGALFVFCMLAMGGAFAALALYTKTLHSDFIKSQEKCATEIKELGDARATEATVVRNALLDAVRQFNETQREQTKASGDIEGALRDVTDVLDRLVGKIDNMERTVDRKVQPPIDTPKQGVRG